MAEFAYLAIAPSGKEQRGHIAAETIAAARAELDRRRLFVMRIDSETRRAEAPALFSLERKKLSAKELTLFTRPDRKSVVEGKGGSVGLVLGGCSFIKKNKKT